MKVMHVIDINAQGGALHQVLTLVESQIEKGIIPILVTGNYPSIVGEIQRHLPKNIKTYALSVASPKDPKHIAQLKEIFLREKPDLIHTHLNHSGACRYVFLANRRIRIPIVATEHDPFKLCPLKTLFKKYTLRHTALTIAVSDANNQFLSRRYHIPKDKMVTIHNGIDLTQFSKKPSHRNKKELIIGSVMELHPRKGPDILIRAFKIVHDAVPDSKLFIAGDGIMKPQLEQLISQLQLKNSVRLFGWINDISQFLTDLDIFVLSSRREAFGLAALEAQAAKVPVIASDIGGLKEIIQDHVTGLLCKPESLEAFADTITFLIENPLQRDIFRHNAYRYLEEQFSVDAMVEKTIGAYYKALTLNR